MRRGFYLLFSHSHSVVSRLFGSQHKQVVEPTAATFHFERLGRELSRSTFPFLFVSVAFQAATDKSSSCRFNFITVVQVMQHEAASDGVSLCGCCCRGSQRSVTVEFTAKCSRIFRRNQIGSPCSGQLSIRQTSEFDLRLIVSVQVLASQGFL